MSTSPTSTPQVLSTLAFTSSADLPTPLSSICNSERFESSPLGLTSSCGVPPSTAGLSPVADLDSKLPRTNTAGSHIELAAASPTPVRPVSGVLTKSTQTSIVRGDGSSCVDEEKPKMPGVQPQCSFGDDKSDKKILKSRKNLVCCSVM